MTSIPQAALPASTRLPYPSPRIPIRTLLPLALLLPAWLPCMAAAADGDTRLEAVVSVASRHAQPAREVAGTVSVIEGEELRRRLGQTIADAVRYEPGVSVPEDAARFGLQGFSIRGLGGNRVGVEVDGIPVADGFAIGSFSNAGRGGIETAFLSRIEILRGPASTLYGSDALAGVVSLRTLTPEDLLRDAGQSVGLRTSFDALSRDGTRSASGVSGWTAGAFELLLGVVRREGSERDNQPRSGGLSSNPLQREQRGELLKLAHSSSAGRLELRLDRGRERVESQLDSFVRGPGQYASTVAMQGDDRQQREGLALGFERPFQLPGLERVQASLYRQRSSSDQFTRQERDAVAPRTPPTLRERRFLFDTETHGLELNAQGRFELLGARHWQVYGIELKRSRISEWRDARETNLLTGAVSSVILGERFPLRDFPITDASTIALYWQDEIRPGDGGLALIPGLRWERYRVDARLDPVFVEDNPSFVPVDLAGSQLTPKFGLRQELAHGVQVFAQYALGFRAPPAADVNIGFTIPSFNYVAIPNPNLKPERSRGLELGLRWSGPSASLEAVAFDNRYRQLIDSRVNLGVDPASGALVFQSINRARARIHGIEMRGDLDLPWPGFTLRGALNWSRGDDLVRRQPLNSIEPATLTLGVSYETVDGRQRLELVATGVAAKTRVDDSIQNVFRSPGYATLDAYWRVNLGERLHMDLGAFNLSDRRYWLWSGVRGLPANAREIDLYTQPGRSFGAQLAWQW